MILIYIFEILDHGILLTSKVSSLVENEWKMAGKIWPQRACSRKLSLEAIKWGKLLHLKYTE